MAEHWDLTDIMLNYQLAAYMQEVTTDEPLIVHLYQNNYTPIVGSTIADYTECDYPGYLPQDQLPTNWGTVEVVGHVASSTATIALEFTAASTGFSSQMVYGYYVIDHFGEYLCGQSFATPKTVYPDLVLRVTPILRHATYPNP